MEALFDGFQTALRGVDFAALVETIGSVIKGEVQDLSLKYCPTPPELSKAVRAKMLQNRRDLLTPRIDYTPIPFLAIEHRRNAAKRRMFEEGRKQLCYCDSDAQAHQLAKHGSVPPGSLYIAILGAIYSPKPEDQDDTRTDTTATDEPQGDFVEPEPAGREAGAQTHNRPGTDDGDRGDGEPAREAERD